MDEAVQKLRALCMIVHLCRQCQILLLEGDLAEDFPDLMDRFLLIRFLPEYF
jgi:hypothetical protein